MIPEKVKALLKKHKYCFAGNHSAVKICNWTKNSLRGEGVCYKEKFYGIKSHRCCQMTPAVVWCDNKCLHCWRAIEHTLGNKINEEIDSAKKIIDECIKAQKKLLLGFKKLPTSKGNRVSKADMRKWEEAQEPTQFAISLSGEPCIYEKLGELIEELKKRNKTSFLVTNGLHPEKLKELEENNQLPTQLYVSVNISNKKDYQGFHNSVKKDAWEKLMQSLEFMKGVYGKTRTVFRINLIRGINMKEENISEFAELVKKAKPMFVEIKGYMAVGFARKRLGYEKMPKHQEILEFGKKLAQKTNLKFLDEHKRSCVCVLGKDEEDLKINKDVI